MFARIVEASLRGRVLVLAAAVVLLALGLRSARTLPVDVLPDLTRPMVTVQAETAGLAAEDVESQVTFPIETALSGLQDVGRLRSVTTPGLAVIYAEFAWDSDPWRNRQLVAERIDAIRPQLAPLAEPRIGPMTSLMGEVLLLSLQSRDGDAGPQRLRELADWNLRPRLLAIPGVAQVLAIGGEVKQYEIHPDAQRMRLDGVRLGQIVEAARGYGVDSGAGVAFAQGSEYALRGVAHPFRLDDLAQAAVAWRGTGPIRLGQVAQLGAGARLKRGDAGFGGRPAVILSVQKQPGADSLRLTRQVERVLATGLPPEVRVDTVFRQADFIEEAVGNVRQALLHGAVIVALTLLLFIAGGRATLVSLAAIPLSLAAAVLVLGATGQSVNTMTLGGLAIAIGELVDDAVVGVENVIRRLRDNAALAAPRPALEVVAAATVEVRSGILYATLLIVLAFAPLFALEGVEGRLFAPLGIAYITAILASLLVAVTLTPVLGSYAFARGLPQERRWLGALKRRYLRRLQALLRAPRLPLLLALLLLLAAAAVAARLPRAFLPEFNERSLTLNLLLRPGVSLAVSDEVGAAAESLALGVPEVAGVGRRTGRAEQDEHAEGLHYSELEIALRPGGRPRAAVVADLRARLGALPATLIFGQPISHRLDHLLSGVRAPLAVKIYGEDLDTLRRLAEAVVRRLQGIPGLADVQAEPQAQAPQLDIRVDPRRAAQYGISPPRVQEALNQLTVGTTLSRIVEGDRRYDLVLRLPQEALDPATLGDIPIDTPAGAVPLRWLGDLERHDGPAQILRENLRRRVAVSAYAGAGRFDAAARAAQQALADLPLPPGYELRVEGEHQAQGAASRRIAGLAALSLLLMLALLLARYRSLRLSLIVLATVPLATIGGVAALALTGTPLSVASLVGFVALAGIAARNGILKLSRYLQLAREGEPPGDALILRGSAERLTPVLMTALIAAAALAPLLGGADAPGKEVLHPVALVIFGGLLGGTCLDSFVTPLLFKRYGLAALRRS
ncbi:MAG TPA: efflux RND transporter permease subunit [Nevskia sp.]|nr:efflux RND transporter permease subunit [Nevskia sp.]